MRYGFRRRRPYRTCVVLVAITLIGAVLSVGAVSAVPARTGSVATAEATWPVGTDVRDVALEGTASASTVFRLQPERFAAEHVNDGDLSTRWASDSPESGYPDASREWVQVELAEPTPVHHVVIHWETAAAAQGLAAIPYIRGGGAGVNNA